jgi:hypothetical protein
MLLTVAILAILDGNISLMSAVFKIASLVAAPVLAARGSSVGDA